MQVGKREKDVKTVVIKKFDLILTGTLPYKGRKQIKVIGGGPEGPVGSQRDGQKLVYIGGPIEIYRDMIAKDYYGCRVYWKKGSGFTVLENGGIISIINNEESIRNFKADLAISPREDVRKFLEANPEILA